MIHIDNSLLEASYIVVHKTKSFWVDCFHYTIYQLSELDRVPLLFNHRSQLQMDASKVGLDSERTSIKSDHFWAKQLCSGQRHMFGCLWSNGANHLYPRVVWVIQLLLLSSNWRSLSISSNSILYCPSLYSKFRMSLTCKSKCFHFQRWELKKSITLPRGTLYTNHQYTKKYVSPTRITWMIYQRWKNNTVIWY